MPSFPGSSSSYEGPERRVAPRLPATALPHLSARVLGGGAVRLVDISKRGVRLEGSVPMPAGSTVTVRFMAGGETQTLTGAVVRDTVVVVETTGEVTYHTALAFTDELTLCGDDFEVAAATLPGAPALTPAPDTAATDDYTMLLFDGRIGTPQGAPADAS